MIAHNGAPPSGGALWSPGQTSTWLPSFDFHQRSPSLPPATWRGHRVAACCTRSILHSKGQGFSLGAYLSEGIAWPPAYLPLQLLSCTELRLKGPDELCLGAGHDLSLLHRASLFANGGGAHGNAR
ncbi:hypothetical protein DPEC_G00109030 [Dallia pectoralis]|uniref:Uncharacterized protein n=1 Tax=Dallia pectoralis TaxID=75939 RepID=A0ACC2GT66_DALPE|nr:hypothetical protein DPEC_G00109030 [Dallia pectoralis]